MKKLFSLILLSGMMLGFNSCSDELDTEPTDAVSGSTIFAEAESAESAINGIYRLMYTAGWTDSNQHQNFGQTSINMIGECMAEDFVMYDMGSGWFYVEDYCLSAHNYYNSKNFHIYGVWNYYYTLISNANYIIAAENTMGGDPEMINSVVGQAYAVRAMSYFYLIQFFQQTYVGNEGAPGIPVYTEPTIAGSIGAPRGTVAETYAQIDSDINRAIELLGSISNKTQTHASHIDYYVANGLKARICLVENDWQGAINAATEALKKPGLTLSTLSELGNCNSLKFPSCLWGMEIISDQSTVYASFFSHMDADAEGFYAESAQKCISTGLYNLIPPTDARKTAWWRGALAEEGSGSNVSYAQLKYRFADIATSTGDYIFMRGEEMILIKAEAECHLGQYPEARITIAQLGNMRDTNYSVRLEQLSNAATYNSNTNAPITTLMDEILLQRRIELWGENPRILDLQRLGLGYNRNYEGSNHTEFLNNKNTNAASPSFIFPLPQSEIDGNENITDADNNPIVS